MAQNKIIKVEVAYARPDQQKMIAIEIEEGVTIEAAIQYSGILVDFPEIDLCKQSVGIFSESRSLSDKVQEGDRIEIYRSLIIDPREARRKRFEVSFIK